ncbi:condensation domain-containing protein, partial [Alcaligenes faecalis]
MMMQQPLTSGAEQFVPSVDFVQRLQALAECRGTETALIVAGMEQGETVEKVFSYTAIWRSVRALAAVLQKTVPAGERALLLLDNDEHYVVSLFACFAAGVIAVPVFPPESNRPQHLKRLTGIASDAQASVILATSRLASLLPDVTQQLGAQKSIQVDQVDEQEANQWQAQGPQQSDIAFLQYTSGSTSAPKGVMVTHACLMANEAAIRYGLSISSRDCFGVWSPLFHDMGLIGGLLQPFYSGIPCVLCSPQYFTASPLRWLQLIDRYRISISGGPDFAYRLCLDRIKSQDCRHLDLSHWRVAYTGAEPVRHDTMRDFVDRFSACGFAAQAVYPCYGLAEATLYITGGQRGVGMHTQAFSASMLGQGRVQVDPEGTVLVGCGQTAPEHTVRIVNPQSLEQEIGDGIGEIWASGPSVAAGYWRNPQASAHTFVTDKSGMRWLRTGDLGFQYQNQLFIAGRLKDMIIVRGHNVYPQDLEQRIEIDVSAVRKGRVAAFAVDVEGKEGVGIAAEVSRAVQKRVSPHELAQQIVDALGPYLGEAPKVIALLNGSGMPKTSSGKLQRQACRAQWQQDTLDAYAIFVNGHLSKASPDGQGGTVVDPAESAEDRAIRETLAEFWAELLGGPSGSEFVPESHFFMLGGNSLSAAQLAMRVSAHYKIVFQPRDVFSHPGLAAMSRAIRLRQQDQTRTVTPILRLDEQMRALAQPLSQEQSSQWFLWKLDPASTAYHVQGAMQIDGNLDLVLFKQAVEQLVQRHGVLRTGFEVQADGQIRQRLQQTSTIALEYRQSGGSALQTREQIIQDFCARPFDLLAGPAQRALLISQSAQQHVLVLVMHHIISDAASMQILLDDLGALYAALQGKGAQPDDPVLHYVDYAAWQSSTKAASHIEAMAYWQKTLGSEHPVLALPYDFPAQVAGTRQAAHHDVSIEPRRGEQLRQLAGQVGATPFVVLMAALHVMLHRYTGQASIRLGVPVSLRDQVGLERMVGFLANTVVLQQSFQPSMTLRQLLQQARDSHQQALAHADLPFDQLVQALRPDRSSGVNPLFQVMFNYLYEDFSAFAQHTGLKVHVLPLEAQQAQFELSLEVREDPAHGMHLRFSYDRARFSAQTVRRMAEHYQMILQAMLSQADVAMAELPLLAEQERMQVMSWGAGPLTDSSALPVHRLFEQQAAACPDAPALIVDDVAVSYETLNTQANRLAHALLARGLGADQLVGIALERSLDMVVSLLAVLK